MNGRWRIRGTAILLLLVLAAACSSTSDDPNPAEDADTLASAETAEPGATAGAAAVDDAAPGAGGAPGARGAAGATSGPRRSAGGGGSAPSKPLAMGTGVTRDTIKIGFHVGDVGAAATAIGAQGVSQSPPARTIRAVTDWVNRNGGIAGRKIDPIIRVHDAAAENWVTAAQAACTQFTEDEKVFAGAATAAEMPDVFISCMASHSTPVVVANDVTYDDSDYERWPNLYTPVALSGSRWGVYIDRLVATKFLTKTSRIGFVYTDRPNSKRIADKVLRPALARHGLKPVAQAEVRQIESTGDLARLAGDSNSAVLQFRSANVDRVIFVATAGGGPFFFLPAAEQQGYRPKYAFTSAEGIDANRENAPAAQLAGARGISWWPQSDVTAKDDPGGRPGETLCKKIFKGAGMTFADRFAEGNAMLACDSIMFLRTALDRAPALTMPGLRSAVGALGTAFQPASTFAARLGSDRHYGAASVRDVVYNAGCSCWKYSGSPIGL